MNIIKIDNALPADLYDALLAASRVGMAYGQKSHSEHDPHGHWTCKFTHDERQNLADLSPSLPGPVARAWAHVRDHHLPRHKPVRVYYNGYTYGTDGYFHRDSERAGEVTAILYLAKVWNRDWAGETVVEVARGEYQYFMPAPNRLLLLPSDSYHCGRGVSRMCPELRKVLVFKSRPERSRNFEELSGWLVGHGALKLKHGANSSLHDHLMRCFQLCEDRALPLPIRRAAGMHSVYGTNAFRHKLINPLPEYRASMANCWGADVENLVYKFSLLDRPGTLDSDQSLLRTSYGESFITTDDERRALRLIECANLADQGALGRWPRLNELWQSVSDKNKEMGL